MKLHVEILAQKSKYSEPRICRRDSPPRALRCLMKSSIDSYSVLWTGIANLSRNMIRDIISTHSNVCLRMELLKHQNFVVEILYLQLLVALFRKNFNSYHTVNYVSYNLTYYIHNHFNSNSFISFNLDRFQHEIPWLTSQKSLEL